jgi:hypothetical protein
MTHDQIREMVRRVNPIPDPNLLETVDAPDLMTERRMHMQTDDRVIAEDGRNRPSRGPLIGIAVAAVFLVAGVVFFLTRNESQVATPAPNATQVTEDFSPLDPGAYYVDTDGNVETATRGTFVIEGDDWASLGAGAVRQPVDDGPYIALLIAELDRVWTPACGAGSAPQPAATTTEEMANQFAATGLSITDAVAPVTAFGHEGYHLAVTVPADCHSDPNMNIWESPNWGGRYYQDEGQIVEYWFLDVEGTPVMVEASRFPDSSEDDVAELQAVVDSLVITP